MHDTHTRTKVLPRGPRKQSTQGALNGFRVHAKTRAQKVSVLVTRKSLGGDLFKDVFWGALGSKPQ